MPTILDRIKRLEAQRDEQSRYKVTYADGTSSIENHILPLLGAALGENCTIVDIEPLHQGPFDILERLTFDFIKKPFNPNEEKQ